MPAKAKSKKVSPKLPKEVPAVVVETAPVSTPTPVVAPPADPPPVEENLEEMLEEDGDDSALEAKNKLVFFAGAIVTVCIIAVTIGVFVVFLNAPKVKKQAVVEDTSRDSASPTPAALSKSAITFEVLNASGVSGAASKVAKMLEENGYTVAGTGNAKKQTATQVFLSKTLPPAAVAQLLSDLSSLLKVSSSSGDLEGATVGARLIIGTK